MQRIADTVAIMLYEQELHADGSYTCLEFIGLDTLIGSVPEGMSPEDAFDSAVHSEDLPIYNAAVDALDRGDPVEVEYRLIGYDGRTRWVLDRMHPQPTASGSILVSGVIADITERKRVQEQLLVAQERELAKAQELAHMALHDPLTGLPNRNSFQEHVELAISRAERMGSAVAVLFIDLDNFKLVNDSFGHSAGDELLKAVGSRLGASMRKMDLVCRQGGDEFLILLTDLPLDPPGDSHLIRATEQAARAVRAALEDPFEVEGTEIYVTASIGISLYPTDADGSETLLKHADVAMYSVKGAGRDGYSSFALGPDTALQQISMAARLRKAIESRRGLVLFYQPIVNLETKDFVGVEALIRWQDGERLIPPDSFIPLAERVGLIGAISDWVIDEACLQASAWQQKGLDLYISINLPPSYCKATGMAHLISSASTAGIELTRLMVEITESALVPDSRTQVESTLAEMRRLGVRLAIDDFGTGYSSIGRLNQARVNVLKIDRSFVQELPDSEHACKLVTSVIQLARTLDLEPIAEGVETEEQRRFLLDLGCVLGQGFLFSRPVPVLELEKLHAGGELGADEVA